MLNLNDLSFDDMADGRTLVEAIQAESRDTMLSMQNTKTNKEWEKLNARHYELLQAKRAVQNRMAKMFQANRKVSLARRKVA